MKSYSENEITEHFLPFINQATSPYHVVNTCMTELSANGFEELNFQDTWNLIPGHAYFTKPYGTTLFAFRIGNSLSEHTNFRIVASHTDHPGFRIKPNPEITEKGYLKLNTETYGGAILNTWMDRPLSIAGKVTLRSNQLFFPETRIVDFKEPLLTIPNLAIHMNRAVNSGIELNKQIDMLPLFSMNQNNTDETDFFLCYLAETLKVDTSDILDFDLYIYNMESGCSLGRKQEFFSSPRLDNLTSVYASLHALIDAPVPKEDILISAFFDNEEIGSRTKQGADSLLTQILLEKIFNGLSFSRQNLLNTIMRSFLISADVAHGYHPNHGAKNDPTNITQLNQGVVLKINSNQKYATDTEAISIIQQICHAYDIPYQKFVNRSDIPGGGTLGSITSSWLPMNTVDLGIPLLAMHSARETCGIKDELALIQLLHAFYSCDK